MLSVLAAHMFKAVKPLQSDYANVHKELNNRTGCTNHLFELRCANKMLS